MERKAFREKIETVEKKLKPLKDKAREDTQKEVLNNTKAKISKINRHLAEL